MVKGAKPTEITSCDQIDQDILQEVLAKTSVLDKSDNENKNLIVKFFNYM